MTIELNSWEAKFVIHALQTLDAQWSATVDNSDDDDIKSEYGMDLAQLEMIRERIEPTASAEFGPNVLEFSRKQLDVTPADQETSRKINIPVVTR